MNILSAFFAILFNKMNNLFKDSNFENNQNKTPNPPKNSNLIKIKLFFIVKQIFFLSFQNTFVEENKHKENQFGFLNILIAKVQEKRNQ